MLRQKELWTFHNSELGDSSGRALVTVPSGMDADGALYSFAMPLL